MKKLIVLGAVASILVLGSNQTASANNAKKNQGDDYRAFKKIVRVLDAVVNDHGRSRGGTKIVFKTRYYPKKTCHFREPRKICYMTPKGHGFYRQKKSHWKHAKQQRFGRR